MSEELHRCKDCGEEDLEKFYFYSYVRAGLLVKKPMGRCKLCVKLQRAMKVLAEGG